MTKTPADLSDKDEQRRRAEAKLAAQPHATPALPLLNLETQRLVHELQVHQIELEMQNEELIQARTDLENLLHQYTDLYNQSPVGYLTLTLDGTIDQINPAGASLLGEPRNHLLKRRLGQYIKEAYRPLFSDFLEKVFSNPDHKETCEIALLHGENPIWAHLEAIGTAKHEVCNAALVDITQRKHAETQLQAEVAERQRAEIRLQEAVTALKTSNIDLEQYAYAVSHDLQEPLRQIIGFTQLLKKRSQGQLGAEADETVRYIVEGAKRMHEMVKGLLEYSRVARGDPKFAPVDCNHILSSAMANLKLQMDEHHGSVIVDPLPTVFGDKVLLIQVFQNLIANAVKFHQPDRPPQIQISAKKVIDPQMLLSLSPATKDLRLTLDQWLFSVRDNGIGIAAEYFDRIFIIFQRLHTQTEYPGLGIGLSLTKRIIERHGGQICLDSQEGVGTTFYFTLPDVP